MKKQKKHVINRIISVCLCCVLIVAFSTSPQKVYAQNLPAGQTSILNLPSPGSMITQSSGFVPALIKGIKIYPKNPFQLDFIVDTGQSGLENQALKKEGSKLIKYFLASLTTPSKELWVNLSPYEKDRIIPEKFGQTEMGRDLLAQDYILKQLTASLIYPEEDLGKEFWDRVYEKANEIYGKTDIPINTFNKVWIVPDEAVVYENGDLAFIAKSHLKVMLEGDYSALKENLDNQEIGTDKLERRDIEKLSDLSSTVVREVILPEIEKEVNEGTHFANLRQIYSSMILATWYKRSLKESILGRVYSDQNKVDGVDVKDKEVKEKIYQQYLEAFKQGVYSYIKEDYDSYSGQTVSRKYFSGGFQGDVLEESVLIGKQVSKVTLFQTARPTEDTKLYTLSTGLDVLKRMENLIEIFNAIAESEDVPQLQKGANEDEVLMHIINYLKGRNSSRVTWIDDQGTDNDGNIIVKLDQRLKRTDLGRKIVQYVMDGENGVKAINFKGTDGKWRIMGFKGEVEDQLEIEQKEIRYRKAGDHWIVAYNKARRGSPEIRPTKSSTLPFKATREDAIIGASSNLKKGHWQGRTFVQPTGRIEIADAQKIGSPESIEHEAKIMSSLNQGEEFQDIKVERIEVKDDYEVLHYSAHNDRFRYLTDLENFPQTDSKKTNKEKLKQSTIANLKELGYLFSKGYIHTSLAPLSHHNYSGRWEWDYDEDFITTGQISNILAGLQYPNLRIKGIADFEHVKPFGTEDINHHLGQNLIEIVFSVSYVGIHAGLSDEEISEILQEGVNLFNSYFSNLQVSNDFVLSIRTFTKEFRKTLEGKTMKDSWVPVYMEEIRPLLINIKTMLAQYKDTPFFQKHVPLSSKYYAVNQGATSDVNQDGIPVWQQNFIIELKKTHNEAYIDIFDKETRRPIVKHPLKHSWVLSLAISDERIFVVNKYLDDVQIFDKNGQEIGRFNYKFRSPSGISVFDGKVYVSDLDKEQILVFDENGTFLFSFGRYGQGNGEFNSPFHVLTFDNQLFVFDARNNRIQLFDKDGNWKETWGENEKLSFPSGGMVLHDKLLVLDNNGERIHVFNKNGEVEAIIPSNEMIEMGENIFVRYIDHRPAAPYVQVIRPAKETLTDQASLSSPVSDSGKPVGGIDLNEDFLNLQTQGQGINFEIPFNLQNIETVPIDGLSPVIFQIIPTNLPLLLGVSESDNVQQLSHAQ